MEFTTERIVPRLLVGVTVDRIADLIVAVPRLAAAGIEGLLVASDGATPDGFEPVLRRLVTDAGAVRVMLAGAPRVAAAVGADVVLPEAGMAAAEARRQLLPGALLGRDVSSLASARLALGVDFLVAAWTEEAMATGGFRAAIESAPCPVIWRVGAARAARVYAAGGEGVLLPFRSVEESVAEARRLATTLPATAIERQVVLLDGSEVDLPPDTAVADLLADLGLTPSRVTRNGALVPRRAWEERLLQPGDVIETCN